MADHPTSNTSTGKGAPIVKQGQTKGRDYGMNPDVKTNRAPAKDLGNKTK